MAIVSVVARPAQKLRTQKTEFTKPISIGRFLNMPKKEDGNKYELVNGNLEKSNHNITTKELKIVKNIRKSFSKTAFAKAGGEMESETKIVLSLNSNLVRIPDISFFTARQIADADDSNFPIPTFVIELISSNDGTYRVEKKILEYFEAGIQVIWVVYPEIKQVKVYTSPKTVTINYDDDICSGAPVIPDIKISVHEIFSF